MKPEDYQDAAYFFYKLRTEGKESVKSIKEAIEEYKAKSGESNPTYVIDVLETAFNGLEDYTEKDLEQLAEMGLKISKSVLPSDFDVYKITATEFKEKLSKVDISTKNFIMKNYDHLKMFVKILSTYAEIRKSEIKLIKTKDIQSIKDRVIIGFVLKEDELEKILQKNKVTYH